MQILKKNKYITHKLRVEQVLLKKMKQYVPVVARLNEVFSSESPPCDEVRIHVTLPLVV